MAFAIDTEDIKRELDYNAVVIYDEKTLGCNVGQNRSCALTRTYRGGKKNNMSLLNLYTRFSEPQGIASIYSAELFRILSAYSQLKISEIGFIFVISSAMTAPLPPVKPAVMYRWDRSGLMIPVVKNAIDTEDIKRELDYRVCYTRNRFHHYIKKLGVIVHGFLGVTRDYPRCDLSMVYNAAQRSKEKVLREILGMMFDVSEYLDCDCDDAVLKMYRRKSDDSFASAREELSISDILGSDYLSRIQKPFVGIKGLYSAIAKRLIISQKG